MNFNLSDGMLQRKEDWIIMLAIQLPLKELARGVQKKRTM